jgi:hypothetical protein
MAESRKPGPLTPPLGSCSIPSRTPGSLGKNDQADPDLTTLLGNTPGPVGVCDWADPTLPQYCPNPYAHLDFCINPEGYLLARGFDSKAATTAATKTKSGSYWVTWADANANASKSVDDLAEPFKTNVKDFIKALQDAGATVEVGETKRSDKRAYLFHWCWLIGLEKKKASEAPHMPGVEIEWNHGNEEMSKKGAKEMIDGFGLAVAPQSTNAPALKSNHIAGKAIDMNITWKNTIEIKKKDGTEESVTFMKDVNKNTKLHDVGTSYGVKKLKTDAPHWSINGH